jgi:hypothetical protein
VIYLVAGAFGFLLSVVGWSQWQAERHRRQCEARVARVRAAVERAER